MPFVQGRLRNEPLSVLVQTECAHCNQPMHIEIDSELNYSAREDRTDPVIFVPDVDFTKLKDPSIIDSF